MATEIINFYHNQSDVVNYDDVLNGDFDFLEYSHNWCQRAFPNYEPSEVVSDAPVLDDLTLSLLKSNVERRVYPLVHKYMRHYAHLNIDQLYHNNRRVTRLLKFLSMLECDDLKMVCYLYFTRMLDEIMASPWNHSGVTLTFWHEALNYKRENNNEQSRTN